MAKAEHGPTDSALAHLNAAIAARGDSFKGELKKADDAIRNVKNPQHKRELTAFWDLIESEEGNSAALRQARAKLEAWNKKNFPTSR